MQMNVLHMNIDIYSRDVPKHRMMSCLYCLHRNLTDDGIVDRVSVGQMTYLDDRYSECFSFHGVLHSLVESTPCQTHSRNSNLVYI